jgi:hypothetical protein
MRTEAGEREAIGRQELSKRPKAEQELNKRPKAEQELNKLKHREKTGCEHRNAPSSQSD